MPRLHHVTVTALKDNVQVVTAKKQLRYRPIEGLPNDGRPDGQDAVYDQTHGISLVIDQAVELDLREDQLDNFDDAIARGDIECRGLSAARATIAAEKKANAEAEAMYATDRAPKSQAQAKSSRDDSSKASSK